MWKKYAETLHNETWLRGQYVVEGKSGTEIGAMLGCPASTVYDALRKAGIELKQPQGEKGQENICPVCGKAFPVGGEGNPKRSQKYCGHECQMLDREPQYRETLHSKEWLEARYIKDGLSLLEIANLIGCPRPTVAKAVNRLGIETRNCREARKVLFDRRGRKDVLQAELIEAYGGKCACCGEDEPAFLTLDHIGGGGGAHRKFYRDQGKNPILGIRQELKALGWPKDKYRLLCMNCNHATRRGATCPHQLKRDQTKGAPMYSVALGHKPAFRCKNCGHLEGAAHAGENVVPHACSVCGYGVSHHPTMKKLAAELANPSCTSERRLAIAQELASGRLGDEAKLLDPDNWEVLADCTPARLAELGLKPDGVAKHTPEKITDPRLGKVAVVNVAEKLGATGKV